MTFSDKQFREILFQEMFLIDKKMENANVMLSIWSEQRHGG